ncbi:CBS domain-containing protein [Streptomyces sp. NPDC051963]|uniref:CBS domain-containing protein n=1 Tax=Streptomyces sp. NPDC051963 TaxID=3365678 RepID=UPI0037D5E4D6
MVRAWTVRGGQLGEREEQALDEGVVIAGWEEAGDLSGCGSIADVGEILARAYPDGAPGTVDNWKHQLWRFITMETGDLVVMPRKHLPVVAVGRLTGGYEYRSEAAPGFRHTRKVEWVRPRVERAAIGGDLRDSIGAFLTVSELRRRDAAHRVETLAQTGVDPGYKGAVEPPSSPEALERDVQEEGTRQLTARDLIGLWGWQRRTGDVIDLVDRELATRGLRVSPHFTEVQLDGLVTVSAQHTTLTGETAQDLPGTDTGQASTHGSSEDLSRHWRIGSLPFAREVVTVGYDEPLSRAITRMVQGDFSQLPVVNRSNVLRGVVTWESIARAQLGRRGETIAAALDPHPHTAQEQEELFVRIDDIQRHGFLIVTDGDNLVLGILTASDLADQLRLRVEPFILLGEAERRLRRLTDRLPVDDLPTGSGVRRTRAAGKYLTLGQYPEVLRDDVCWARLGWPYEQDDLVRRITAVKDYRNELAHWDMDAPETKTEALTETKQLLSLLKLIDHDPRP